MLVDMFAEAYYLAKRQLKWCFEQSAPDADRKHPYLSPLLETDLSEL
jgi:hypothetical protein